VSKKESEFDRYARMKKLQKEAEVEKRKSNDIFASDVKTSKGKPKINKKGVKLKNSQHFWDDEDEYEYI